MAVKEEIKQILVKLVTEVINNPHNMSFDRYVELINKIYLDSYDIIHGDEAKAILEDIYKPISQKTIDNNKKCLELYRKATRRT